MHREVFRGSLKEAKIRLLDIETDAGSLSLALTLDGIPGMPRAVLGGFLREAG